MKLENVTGPEWVGATYIDRVFGLSRYRLRRIESEIEIVRLGDGHRLYNVESIRRYLERQKKPIIS